MQNGMTRRELLKIGGTCAAHLGMCASFGLPAAAQSLRASDRRVEAEEPFGRIERISDGIWAVISTPLSGAPNARTTLCNGGIVSGRSGVAVVEGFASAEGAMWVAEQAKRLTGQDITHVVLTHFHGDHAGGLLGYGGAGRTYVTTAETRERLKPRGAELSTLLSGAQLVAPAAPISIDLNGRQLRITPRSGHTTSDLDIVIDDPAVQFGGDLLWNRYFPNYVDAIPSMLSREVRALSQERAVVRVPGHGPILSGDDLTHYIGVIDLMEEAARKARASGTPAAEAAKAVTLPASLGEWTFFNQNYFEVALRAWERETAKPQL